MTTVRILHVPGCTNLETARRRVREAVTRLDVPVTVEEQVVVDDEAARRLGMPGSPTVLVDGRDVADPGDAPPSMACRLYRTGDAVDGAPPVHAIVAALDSATRRI